MNKNILVLLSTIWLTYWLFGTTGIIIVGPIAILLETLNWRSSSVWIYESYWHKKIFRGITATTFGRYIITKYSKIYISALPGVIKHEEVHVKQYHQWSVFGFLLIYTINFMINIFRYWNLTKAYHNIIFEKQAYNEAHK